MSRIKVGDIFICTRKLYKMVTFAEVGAGYFIVLEKPNNNHKHQYLLYNINFSYTIGEHHLTKANKWQKLV